MTKTIYFIPSPGDKHNWTSEYIRAQFTNNKSPILTFYERLKGGGLVKIHSALSYRDISNELANNNLIKLEEKAELVLIL